MPDTLMSYAQRKLFCMIGLKVTVVKDGVQTTGELKQLGEYYTVIGKPFPVTFRLAQVTMFVQESVVDPRRDRQIIMVKNLDTVDLGRKS